VVAEAFALLPRPDTHSPAAPKDGAFLSLRLLWPSYPDRGERRAPQKRLRFRRLRLGFWLAAYVVLGLLLAVFVQSFVNWLSAKQQWDGATRVPGYRGQKNRECLAAKSLAYTRELRPSAIGRAGPREPPKMHVSVWGFLLSFTPAAALGKRPHRRLACRLIAVRWRAALMVREYQRPHPP
jgi:hypothetical protein